MRANYANNSIGCIPTYLIYSSVKPFLITALNCLNTEGIPAHSEKYTVRGSIARAARVVTSIYIVANGNDHVKCETSSTASRSKSAIRDF